MVSLFFIVFLGFLALGFFLNREKLKKRWVSHPTFQMFFRPPTVYGFFIAFFICTLWGGIGLGITMIIICVIYASIPGLHTAVSSGRHKIRTDILSGTTGSHNFSQSVHQASSGQRAPGGHTPTSFTFSPVAMTFSLIKKVLMWIIVGIILIFILSKGLPRYTVSPGEIALITRLGKLQENYATEGLNFKIPLIDKVIRINIQTQKVEATANAASKDLQNISATIAVNGNIQASFAKELYRNLGDATLIADKIINPSIQESVKAATAKYTAEELITKRTAVSQEIKVGLVEKLEKWGIQVSDVNIVNFQFSADFDAAIEKKVKAEQEALAEKNKLESVKFQAQQSIERSKAEAESIRIQAEAIKSQGGAEYVNLKWIEKWDGKLPQTSLGSSNGLILNLKQ